MKDLHLELSKKEINLILAALSAIDAIANEDMLAGNPIEGAHKRAIDRYRRALRGEK